MRRRRSGYALIELLLVISSLAVVMGLCMALLHALLKLDRSARSHLAEASSRDRLARQFRQDARASSRFEPKSATAPQDRIELLRPDGRVVLYRAREGHLVRTERSGDSNVRSESYNLPSRGIARFSVHVQDGSSFASLVLPRKKNPVGGERSHEIRIEAHLGKDLLSTHGRETPR